jgi:hypothetical protein
MKRIRKELQMFRLAVAASIFLLTAVAEAALPSAQVLSARSPAVTPPAGGNGDSVDAAVSPDGRFVAFTSGACDIVPGDDRQYCLNVYLRDRASNTTVRASMNLAGTAGGYASSFLDQVSTNGQFVLFESGANNLAAADTNWSRDIFICNVPAATNILVSAATNGGSANNSSYDAAMTPDARYVAFVSVASNLVPGGTTNGANVFLRDLAGTTTTLVSVGASGFRTMAAPQITPDGRYVAFFCTATGLVASASPSTNGEVYVRDCLSGTTTWASVNAATLVQSAFGTAAPTKIVSYRPRISDDGRYVAFMSGGTSISNGAVILVYDQLSSTTTLVTTNALGSLTPGTSYPPTYGAGDFGAAENRFGPEMTTDGRFIAYASREPAAGGTNASVHVWDSLASSDVAVSTNASGVPTNTISYTPAFSSNGTFVVFLSNATNLVANPVSPGFHLYLCNLQSGGLQLVDVDTNGVGSTDIGNTFPCLSADGRTVVFSSPDGSLVAGDWNNAFDIFARDTIAGTNELISQRNPAMASSVGNGLVRKSSYSISGDGRWFVFESPANDLVSNDTNGCTDIFLRDLWVGQTTLVSATAGGSPALGGNNYGAAISANARYVVFASAATNFASTTNLNIYRKDLQTGALLLVSASTNGSDAAAGNCSDAVISSDGRYVTFLSSAANLAPGTSVSVGGINTFWRDLNSATTVVLNSAGAPTTFFPSMSADGRYVAYQTNQLGQLRIRDTKLGKDIYTNSAAILSAAISPDGSRLLYRWTNSLGVDRITPKTNLFSFNSTVPIQSSGQWSSDGRYITFVGNTNAVYVCDLTTSNVTLVSFSTANSGIANAPSDMPVISGDGRYVAYRSYATDIVTGDTNPAPKIFLFNRASGQNMILSAAQFDASPLPWISAPVISGGAENVAFLSVGSDLVANDLNRAPDALAVRVLYRLQIAPLATPNGTVTLTWQTAPSRTYGVQFKNNLNDSQWQDSSATISFVGSEAIATLSAGKPGCFYRIVENQ